MKRIKHFALVLVGAALAMGGLLIALGQDYIDFHAPAWLRGLSYKLAMSGQAGSSIVNTVIMLVLAILIVGTVIPAMWPLAVESLTSVAAMNGTDTGTTLIKALWPVGVMVAAIGLGIWLILYAIRRLGISGGGGKKGGTGW
jgi:hypothetical protein